MAHARNGEEFRGAQALAGTPVDARETIVELTWRAVLSDWLTLQPVVQYTLNPDTDPALADSLAVGLRFELGWSRGW
ncbi:MAG: carbohydrate porin [Gammaproteobacteria bacterium]|nr:carbohydrate porin [Gammaproteobacteria bacterium]